MIPRLPKGFSHPMQIGEGAFATVYRVRQTALNRWVAIKMLHEKDASKKKDLIKEANIQASIHAECIPQVYHIFEWKSQVCIVMEWVNGIPLSHLAYLFPSEEEKLWIADSFIKNLAKIHSLKYAHRDLKPENIIISPQKGIMLVDFGFTKNIEEAKRSVSGVVKGTPAYMAPELWSGKADIDFMRCDVFAAGKILKNIFSDKLFSDFVNECISEDPMQRPANGIEMLTKWLKISPQITQPNWKKFAHNPSLELLSKKLSSAAKELLIAKRYEEAYWLLVESIEANPQNTDAITLMNSYPEYVKRKNLLKRVYSVSAIFLFIIISISAFFVGRKSKIYYPVIQNYYNHTKKEKMFLSSFFNFSSNYFYDIKLKQDSLSLNQLVGTLIILNPPSEGKIFVDNTPIENKFICQKGIQLPYGHHFLYLINDQGDILFKEKVNLLPFESHKVYINLNNKGNNKP